MFNSTSASNFYAIMSAKRKASGPVAQACSKKTKAAIQPTVLPSISVAADEGFRANGKSIAR